MVLSRYHGPLHPKGWLSQLPRSYASPPSLTLEYQAPLLALTPGMILLTGNRSLEPGDTLERIIRQHNTPSAFPVLSITQSELITYDRHYPEWCLDRLLEIVENLESYKGGGRIFLP